MTMINKLREQLWAESPPAKEGLELLELGIDEVCGKKEGLRERGRPLDNHESKFEPRHSQPSRICRHRIQATTLQWISGIRRSERLLPSCWALGLMIICPAGPATWQALIFCDHDLDVVSFWSQFA
jgi:hypothetical protein